MPPTRIKTQDINDAAITYVKMQDISAASRLLGRGSAAGAGDVQELTLGTGLSMSGTVLNANQDHGTLTGLGDDDHSQYVHLAPSTSSRNTFSSTTNDITVLTVKSSPRTAFAFVSSFRTTDDLGTVTFEVFQGGSGVSDPTGVGVYGFLTLKTSPAASSSITVKSPSLAASRTLTLPPSASQSGAALKATDGSGSTEWYPEATRGIFGDGYEGDFTTSGNITLTRPRFWNNLTVATGHTITTGGYRIHVKGTLTLQGTGAIRRDGSAGGAATGATAGSAGAALSATSTGGNNAGTAGATGGTGVGAAAASPTSQSNCMGVSNLSSSSGAGGNGGSGAGGAASASAGATIREMRALTLHLIDGVTQLTGSAAGRGGSSGAGDGTNTGGGGGGGGSGGGINFIIAKDIVVGASAAISANGGGGGKGGNSSAGNTGGGGGGAGGAGGVVFLIYETLSNSGTIQAIGGTGGSFGTGFGTGTSGGAGNNGQNGYVLEFNTLRGAWE